MKITVIVRNKIRYLRDKKKYLKMQTDARFTINKKNKYMIYDDDGAAGCVDSHYFLQDLYFSKMINNHRPELHYDIGSRIDGFIAQLLAANCKVVMLDIRPFSIPLEGLDFVCTDATNLTTIQDNSLDSLSCLHALEHFGLGRYGDEIDPNAWKKALHAIQRVLKSGGLLYLGVPIGKEDTVCFNAHRIFKPQTIIEELYNLEIVSFAYINDYKVTNVNIAGIDNANISNYDCGLFVFKKV